MTDQEDRFTYSELISIADDIRQLEYHKNRLSDEKDFKDNFDSSGQYIAFHQKRVDLYTKRLEIPFGEIIFDDNDEG